jgi:ATP-dependent exoDNAse (exonuclease V) beta subunit
MSLPPLTIIPAGAGSGKTHSIQEQLGEWVVNGEIAPERIVAVTFTEAAASELSERIRGKLLEEGKLDEALRLDQAYISTIHGFGIRLLTEFAFDAGLSPRPRLINEDEENILIRLALSQTDKVDAVLSQLSQFGYSYNYNAQLSAEEMFREDLLRMVQRLRSAGWNENKASYVNHAVQFIRDQYGEVNDGDTLTDHLHACVTALLDEYPESVASLCEGNNAAYKALTNDFKVLSQAANKDVLTRDFKVWQALRKLRQSNNRCKLPPHYDEHTSAIIEAANRLPHHPGHLQQAETHIRALIEGGQDVLMRYATLKRNAGLVDYTDMIAMADQMLREQPNVLEALLQRIDCLVVDEFQDTNPLQFSLLWQLQSAGIPTMVVGDLKQAIMGFQGADPRLFDQLEQQYQDVAKPLDRNWRSQPAVMEFVNALGPGLFGEAYTVLVPQEKETNIVPLEAIEFSVKAKKDQHRIRAYSLGKRIQTFLQDDTLEVKDPRTKEIQKLCGGHIAVLCPTRNMLSQYASVFRAMGLRVRFQEDEWFTSRVVQLVWHALAYVANPNDRHASLYLSVTELGALSLEEAVTQLMDDDAVSDSILEALQEISISVMDRTVYVLVERVLQKLDIFNVISRWPDCEQARANVLRLLAEVSEFMEANREAMASGGFYGSGLQSFLAWLAQKVQHKDGNTQPDPTVLDEDAIELVTWHSSKGREWPIVAVCGLERTVKADLPEMSIGYRRFDELDKLLDLATIEYSPKFAAPEKNEQFIQSLQVEQESETLRLLYVAMTRAREKLIVEWPSYLNAKAVTYCSLLMRKTGLSLREEHWQIGECQFPCVVTQGESELPEDIDLESKQTTTALPSYGRRAIEKDVYTGTLTSDSVTPSSLKLVEDKKPSIKLQTIQYSPAFSVDVGLTGMALGTFLHQCFEVLGVNEKNVNRIEALTGIKLSDDHKQVIVNQVSLFDKWVTDYYSSQSILREWPILYMDSNQSVVSGSIDLLIQTKDGVWILDHKSDDVEYVDKAFQMYKPQLDAYAEALRQSGYSVLGVGIHWIRRGEVVWDEEASL